MPYTFISYARENSPFALQLVQALRDVGVEVWIDQRNLSIGTRWDRDVQHEIESCERFVIILSPDSVVSENVQDELALALDEKKTIVPVLFRECKTPLRLRRLQWVDFRRDFQSALQELLKDLYATTLNNEQINSRQIAQPAPKIINPPDGMAYIPSGYFLMGGDETKKEKPVHKVYLNCFFLDKYQLSVEQYERFLLATQSNRPGFWDYQVKFSKRPIVYVNWDDAQAFAKWLGKRLPTEAEWEYAARGGFTGLDRKPHYKYPWGDSPDPAKANFDVKGVRPRFDEKAFEHYLTDVGSYPPNGFGLYDMSGNVWEWCADWFNEEYYKSSPQVNPSGPAYGELRVLRGGAWTSNPKQIRCAYRNQNYSINGEINVGFRCAQNVP